MITCIFEISLKLLSRGFPFAFPNGAQNLSLRRNNPLLRFWLGSRIYPCIYMIGKVYLIAKILGNPVKIDKITVDGSRGSFARVCIEIDVLQARQERIHSL